MRFWQRFGYIAFLGGCLSCPAHSAIQGELAGEQSVAVTTITLNIEPNIQISNVSDIVLEVTDRSQDISYEERICVRGNTGSRYSVVAANQDGSNRPYELSTEAGETISFDVYFRGDLSRVNNDQLFPGEPSPFYPMFSTSQDCNGDDTAAFIVVFRSEQLLPAAPGVYSGFLTLTVAAE